MIVGLKNSLLFVACSYKYHTILSFVIQSNKVYFGKRTEAVAPYSPLKYSWIMKLEERFRAVELRKRGKSYSEIRLQMQVSKSTLSRWLREIELTAEQKNLLRGRELSRLAGAKAQQQKRIERTKKVVEKSEKEISLLINNPLFLAGLMLYWAEGDKHKGERVKFTNSDENAIILMMKWFREICKIPEEKFRIALHIHNLHSRPEVKAYWSEITGIPLQNFHKVFVKKTSLRQRRNILYNGTCGIVINNKELFRKIVGWKMGLLKYFRIYPPVTQLDRIPIF